jgi:hypothetical protein
MFALIDMVSSLYVGYLAGGAYLENSEWTFTISALALTYNRRARVNDGFDERLENFNALK